MEASNSGTVKNAGIHKSSDEEVGEHSLADKTETIRTIYNNICKCELAAHVHYKMQSLLVKWKGVKYLTNVEDSLLNLTCSGSVNALFFSMCLKFIVADKTYYVNQYFEYGSFDGFNEEIFQSCLLERFDNLFLPYALFAKSDKERKKERDQRRFLSVRKENSRTSPATFQRQLTINKSSIANSYESMINMFDSTDDNMKFLFSMICVIPKSRKFKDISQQKIFLCSERDNIEFENQLLQYYESDHVNDRKNFLLHDELESSPDLNKQYQYISLLPNFHKWAWENENPQSKFVQRFCCSSRYRPLSPRNRILQAMQKQGTDEHLIVYSIIKCLIGETCEIPYNAIKMVSKAKRSLNKNVSNKKVKRKHLDGQTVNESSN